MIDFTKVAPLPTSSGRSPSVPVIPEPSSQDKPKEVPVQPKPVDPFSSVFERGDHAPKS